MADPWEAVSDEQGWLRFGRIDDPDAWGSPFDRPETEAGSLFFPNGVTGDDGANVDLGEDLSDLPSSISEEVGDTASDAAADTANGLAAGLFGDLKSAAGTIVLALLALVVGSVVLGFSLPFGGK